MQHSPEEIKRLTALLHGSVDGKHVGMKDARTICELLFNKLCQLHGVTAPTLSQNPTYIMGVLMGFVASENAAFARTAMMAGNQHCVAAEYLLENRAGLEAQIEKSLAELCGQPVTEN